MLYTTFIIQALKKTIHLAGSLIAFLFIISVASCSERNAEEKKEVSNGDVLINYTDTKQGDTVLLFIHGWGIDHSYWKNQVDYFSNTFRVVTLDLPGFGKSGKNRSSWTVENYASDVNALINQLHLKNVILVGHSMSGAIIVETGLKYPSNIIGLVGIDNMKDIDLVMTPEMEKEWSAFYERAKADYKGTVAADLKNLFASTTDTLIKKRVSDDILNSDPTISLECLKNIDSYPFATRLKNLNKPLYLVNSDYTPTDTSSFAKNNISCKVLSVGLTGHYPMIEAPEKFNAVLMEAIEGIKSR